MLSYIQAIVFEDLLEQAKGDAIIPDNDIHVSESFTD